QEVSDVDHEQGQISGIGHGSLGGVHEVFQTPELLGIAEVELDLEAKLIVVHQQVKGEGQVGTEQEDVSLSLSFEVGLDDDHDIQGVSKLVVQQRHLVDGGVNHPFTAAVPERLAGDVLEIEWVPVLAMRAIPAVRP